MATYPREVDGFERTPWSSPLEIHEPELHVLAKGLRSDDDARRRAYVARELAAPLGSARFWHGPAYTAWRLDPSTIMVSMLPGEGMFGDFVAGEMTARAASLGVTAVWRAIEPGWARIDSQEFRSTLDGLFADRRGVRMAREASLKVVIDRGVDVRFPVVPQGAFPEPLCGWVTGTPPAPGLRGWDRDPMLVSPQVDTLGVVRHEDTGVAVLPYRIQGSWSDEALAELEETFGLLLPGRFVIRPVRHGCARFSVFLGLVDPIRSQTPSVGPWDCAEGDPPAAVVTLAAAVIARFRGRDEYLDIDPPEPADALPAPGPHAANLFRQAEAAMADAEMIWSQRTGWSRLERTDGYVGSGLYEGGHTGSLRDHRAYVHGLEEKARRHVLAQHPSIGRAPDLSRAPRWWARLRAFGR